MRDAVVLCYHAVSPTWTAPLSVTPERLEWQLRRLVNRGYRGATFSQLVAGELDGNVVAVTFDDAFRSVLTQAAPILAGLDLVGTVFVPTAFPERGAPMAWPGIDHWLGGEFESELTPLSWSEIELLAARGWEIGSHTCSHPHLTQLDDERLEAELRDSQRECEQRLGRPCTSIAYPYGDYDERVVIATRRAGYACAATLPARLHPPRAHAWPRIGIYHGDGAGRYALKVSPPMRRLRGSALWDRLDAVRRGRSAPSSAARA